MLGNDPGKPYHLCSFGAGDGELKVGVFFPVSEKERELGQETVIGISHGGDSLRIGVAVDPTLQLFSGAH